MNGSSNSEPVKLESFGKIFQVRWNIQQSDFDGENNETITRWSYEYVNCNSLNRAEIIRSIMHDKYPYIDDELAIINNQETNPDEYQEYQSYRNFAKQIADETLQLL